MIKGVIKLGVKKNNIPQFSASISGFLDIIRTATADYRWNKEEVGRLDKLTQDYLHKLELENLTYGERAKVATKLAQCRKLRRESKDTVEILEPFILFLENDKGKRLSGLLSEVLGKVRKLEERMEGRTYRYRVLNNDEANTEEGGNTNGL